MCMHFYEFFNEFFDPCMLIRICRYHFVQGVLEILLKVMVKICRNSKNQFFPTVHIKLPHCTVRILQLFLLRLSMNLNISLMIPMLDHISDDPNAGIQGYLDFVIYQNVSLFTFAKFHSFWFFHFAEKVKIKWIAFMILQNDKIKIEEFSWQFWWLKEPIFYFHKS